MAVDHDLPTIASEQRLPELTLKVIGLSIILTIVLAAANAYLALKVGILTSASIPAAILSMAILRLFKTSNILENNLVQTAASAGEAVAGGIVYTVPALIIIRFWDHFGYWENVGIALLGGVLGVLFSIPLRKVLVSNKDLRFPEGRAIAEVLQLENQRAIGVREMLWGGAVGGLLELAQTGLKLMASTAQAWFIAGKTLIGFSVGFSTTLVGAGYLIGFNVAFSIFLGAVIGWIIGVPAMSHWSGLSHLTGAPEQMVMTLWNEQIRYIGIGAMLLAGVWTLLSLAKPFARGMALSLANLSMKKHHQQLPRIERDISLHLVLCAIALALCAVLGLFMHIFPLGNLGLFGIKAFVFVLMAVVYVLVIGFIFSAICGYFSGLVGVTATPGSAVIIAGLLLAALILRTFISWHSNGFDMDQYLLSAAAITIMVGSVITGIACIANDNIQDLKVGHLVGATPWKQQVMLIVGVVISSLVIPPIMDILFNVYGIGGIFPHPGMDPSKVLAAPPAALMAAITQGVFHHNLPWHMLGLGASITLIAILANQLLKQHGRELSILGLAIGIYLPLTTSIPLFIGGLIAFITNELLKKRSHTLLGSHQPSSEGTRRQKGMLLACGLVSGAAVMNVILAIPFAIAGNPDVLTIMPVAWNGLAIGLAVTSLFALFFWFYRVVCAD